MDSVNIKLKNREWEYIKFRGKKVEKMGERKEGCTELNPNTIVNEILDNKTKIK